MLEENCNIAEDRISCLESELRDVTVIADESALKFDEVVSHHFQQQKKKHKKHKTTPIKMLTSIDNVEEACRVIEKNRV